MHTWLNNIDNMYHKLPDDVKGDIKEAYASVLRRALANGEKVLPKAISSKLKAMLSEVERPSYDGWLGYYKATSPDLYVSLGAAVSDASFKP